MSQTTSNREEISYCDKCQQLEPWFKNIVHAVKKELRREHLAKDRAFFVKHFPKAVLSKVSGDELFQVYKRAVQPEAEKSEDIAEFILSQWVVKNSDIYYHFEEELKKIDPDFSSLTAIEDIHARAIIESSHKLFGAIRSYLFVVINEVVFSEAVLEEMRQAAHQQLAQEEKSSAASGATSTSDLELQIKRQQERYEKKLLGLQRIHEREVCSLKKQLAALQRQVAAK